MTGRPAAQTAGDRSRPGRVASGPDGERGSATVLAVVLVGFLAVVTVLGAAVAGLVVGQRRADAAADLAALAGAAAHQRGEPACAVAGRIATANDTELVGCELSGDEVSLRVAVRVDSMFGRTWTLRARARAGPVR